MKCIKVILAKETNKTIWMISILWLKEKKNWTWLKWIKFSAGSKTTCLEMIWINGWIDGWMHGWMNDWMNKYIHKTIA